MSSEQEEVKEVKKVEPKKKEYKVKKRFKFGQDMKTYKPDDPILLTTKQAKALKKYI